MTKNLRKHFGEVRAVDGVDLAIKEGSLSAIIGPNGAGKTTLFNIITGMLSPDSGKIILQGEDITNLSAYKIVKKGITRSFQLVQLFENFTVIDGIKMAVLSQKGKCFNMISHAGKMEDVNEEAREVLSTFELVDKMNLPIKNLPHGDRKILDIAIAFATKPKLLLLDEPTSGISRSERDMVTEFIRKLAEGSVTILNFIEHDIDVVRRISDLTFLMHQGKILARGETEKILKSEKVEEVYFGR